MNVDFNSHAHVERDPANCPKGSQFSISTHTLTWSVTNSGKGRFEWEEDFNSHAHVERDEFDNDNNASYLNFNSHAHVERD